MIENSQVPIKNPEERLMKDSESSTKEESLGIEHYCSEMRKFMEEYEEYSQYLTEQDLKHFMEGWVDY